VLEKIAPASLLTYDSPAGQTTQFVAAMPHRHVHDQTVSASAIFQARA
jgi:hypothetical protein